MIRCWGLATFAMIFCLTGCSENVKAIQVNRALRLEEDTTSKVRALKEKVVAATEKLLAGTDKERELDLSEPIKECETLKKFCKDQVQKGSLEIQSLRLAVTPAEKEELNKKFDGTINAKTLTIIKETEELDAAIKKLESTTKTVVFKNDQKREEAKTAIEDLKKKYGEAQAEFESLNRKS